MSDKTRELTPSELKVIGLLRTLEDAADRKRLTVSLFAGKEAAEAAAKLDPAVKMLKCDYDKVNNKYIITYTVSEFVKYTDFILKQVGLTLREDGSLKTFDNLVISNEYLQ